MSQTFTESPLHARQAGPGLIGEDGVACKADQERLAGVAPARDRTGAPCQDLTYHIPEKPRMTLPISRRTG